MLHNKVILFSFSITFPTFSVRLIIVAINCIFCFCIFWLCYFECFVLSSGWLSGQIEEGINSDGAALVQGSLPDTSVVR